ncbi:class 1 fructose-bisphosphatase [Amaricoccus sp.]|uniref:class 1 fructose-bisphosphatase n=1 Tax=Amaricoccus sp. TaxID=1872485 RepID=UPI001B6C5244|nr:class 1 fructose-bisphosphatase [Amaricoccus sp.]MBP7243515.1 class 1 fructose-bisphosphatase [Amaricoccus sp.]
MLDDAGPIDLQPVPAAFRAPLAGIAAAARDLALTIAGGAGLGAAAGRNADGDHQVALDLLADAAFRDALAGTGVRWYASEELDDVAALGEGALAVAIDPLDGSSNLDVNVSVGTIFGIYPAEADPRASFLRPGRDLLAAGYVIYGPQTALVASFGDGVMRFVLDAATGAFRLAAPDIRVPPRAPEFAINASNHRHWPQPVRAFVGDCLAGAEGPLGHNFNMRWIASLVAEVHRILTRGGVFLYPADDRAGYEHGRLRRVYECAPVAWLIEQAGGRATDGAERILDQAATSLHERTPFVFGSADIVASVAAYHAAPPETSALFGQRGLFRS